MGDAGSASGGSSSSGNLGSSSDDGSSPSRQGASTDASERPPIPDARPSEVSTDPAQIPPGCNAWTCSLGCCESDGGCLAISQDTCGSNGDACEKCASDAFCRGPGSCFRQQPNCNASNCNGCCTDPTRGYCATGVHNTLCGHDGEICARCVPSEGTGQCVSQPDGGGSCTVPPCSSVNCAGCCYGDVCSVGTQDIACGQGGVACVDCVFLSTPRCVGGVCSK
jgi:hypothetical protein